MSTRSSGASSTAPEASARDLLRAGTRLAHERVDEAFGRFDLRAAEGYRAFLLAHAGAFLPLEDGLDRFGAERLIPDWRERRRGSALRADLEALGLAPPVGRPHAIGSDAEALGILYVLEGSRFGGRIIARALAPGLPTRYIAAVHAPGGWTRLVEGMNKQLSDKASLAVAVAAANRAFALFEDAADGLQGMAA